MTHYQVNKKEVFFILKDQLGYGSLCALPRYKGLSEKALDLLVTEAIAFAKKLVAPLQEIGELHPPVFENGKVICDPEFRRVYQKFAENGFVAVARDTAFGGQGFPHMMRIVVNEFMYGACQGFNMAPSLTHGAGHLIETFSEETLKRLYVPRCYNGDWTGTMCLTEPDAGSDLGNIQTTAFHEGDHFKIKGTKTFISWGEHDLTENIVHLVLARIKGAPSGTRGISLFIVPKIRVNPDGSFGEPNDVICRGIEEKLGLHASPTCTLEFGGHDDCIGYLCGRENKGLAHMFQMMNLARINAGVSGMTLASTAYLNALDYVKKRVQGRGLAEQKNKGVPIIEHPDVRRMLLEMKAAVEGMRSMIYTGAFWSDLAMELADGKQKTHYQNLCDFMTPVIKAYCSDTGFRVCETAIQCLGGYGYCKDFPLEQYLRDVKIMSLYEGTNGIQAMDLMGRKMEINSGAPFLAFKQELEAFCIKNKGHERFGRQVRVLADVAGRLFAMALDMRNRRKTDPLQWASYTFPAMRCFGDVIMAWRLCDMAIIAHRLALESKPSDFYTGKMLSALFFTDTLLPQTMARIDTCTRDGREIVEMPRTGF